jgi:hypothetical protein
MKKLTIAAASLMFAASAQASQPEYSIEIGVVVTPIVAKQVLVSKTASRFDNYALENVAAGGQ